MSGRPSEEHPEEQRDNLRLLNQVMRHDIRNDLQLIGAYAELLEDHVDEGGRQYLEVINENTESATNLTTTARDLSKSSSVPIPRRVRSRWRTSSTSRSRSSDPGIRKRW
jgi:signal transduction histidine kinase